ncbi:MAG: hypothetical protein JO327_05620 [Nitrososphaeraceae archaeon]|nr:hypothetical protein [Nitrososphaeraceae archaeon]
MVASSTDSGNEDDKESNEPNYDEDDRDLIEEKQEQTGEIKATTNKVFLEMSYQRNCYLI